jgi:hypothetical protein
MQAMKKMPDCFTVEKTPFGLYTSRSKDGKELVTSATEETCRAMTHFYLKGLQDGFTRTESSYTGTVGGKL